MCVVDCARVVRRLADVAGKGWAGTGALMCVCVWPAACGRLARHVVAALVLVRSCVRVASGVSSESVRVVAGALHAHDEGRVDPHHWRL